MRVADPGTCLSISDHGACRWSIDRRIGYFRAETHVLNRKRRAITRILRIPPGVEGHAGGDEQTRHALPFVEDPGDTLDAGFGDAVVYQATSANVSGAPPATSADEIVAQLGDSVDLVLDGGATTGGLASTIVDVTSGKLELVREGAIAFRDVLRP